MIKSWTRRRPTAVKENYVTNQIFPRSELSILSSSNRNPGNGEKNAGYANKIDGYVKLYKRSCTVPNLSDKKIKLLA